MTGLDEDNPLIGLISEEQYLEENNVENGDLLCNSKDSSSSPETETASPKEEDDLNEDDRLQSSSSVIAPLSRFIWTSINIFSPKSVLSVWIFV